MKDKKSDLIRKWADGQTVEAFVAGLCWASCTTAGCQAVDFWLKGDRRDQKRAIRWADNHKKHSRI